MTNGRAIEEDVESRNLDEFKGNYISEEKIMNTVRNFVIFLNLEDHLS